nr:MAG TPA: hypothetical protein [Caudoviricetes sp.]
MLSTPPPTTCVLFLFFVIACLYNAPYSHGAFMAAVQYNSISE